MAATVLDTGIIDCRYIGVLFFFFLAAVVILHINEKHEEKVREDSTVKSRAATVCKLPRRASDELVTSREPKQEIAPELTLMARTDIKRVISGEGHETQLNRRCNE